jgi:hypothetical protein
VFLEKNRYNRHNLNTIWGDSQAQAKRNDPDSLLPITTGPDKGLANGKAI